MAGISYEMREKTAKHVSSRLRTIRALQAKYQYRAQSPASMAAQRHRHSRMHQKSNGMAK